MYVLTYADESEHRQKMGITLQHLMGIWLLPFLPSKKITHKDQTRGRPPEPQSSAPSATKTSYPGTFHLTDMSAKWAFLLPHIVAGGKHSMEICGIKQAANIFIYF